MVGSSVGLVVGLVVGVVGLVECRRWDGSVGLGCWFDDLRRTDETPGPSRPGACISLVFTFVQRDAFNAGRPRPRTNFKYIGPTNGLHFC